MDPFLLLRVLSALGVALVGAHATLDWEGLLMSLRTACGALGIIEDRPHMAENAKFLDALKETRLSHATEGIKNFSLLLIGFIMGILICVLYVETERQASALVQAMGTVVAIYTVFLPFASGRVKLTPGILATVVILAYGVQLLRLLTADASDPSYFLLAGSGVVVRMACGMVLQDRKLSACLNFVVMCVRIWSYQTSKVVFLGGHHIRQVAAYASEIIAFLGTCLLNIIVEEFIKMRVQATCQSDDAMESAQQMLKAFRTLLTVLCDADVLLNRDLEIVEPCPKFQHMVTMSAWSDTDTLPGRQFEDFVAFEDRQRFREFILWIPGEEDENPPRSITVSLKGAAGLGAGGRPQHLLGIREVDESSMSRGRGSSDRAAAAAAGLATSTYSQSESRSLSEIRSISASQTSRSESGYSLDYASSRSSCSRKSPEWQLCLDGLKSMSVQVDVLQTSFPIREVTLKFKDSVPAAGLMEFVAEEFQGELKAPLLIAGIALRCGKEPQELLVENAQLRLPWGIDTSAGKIAICNHPEPADAKEDSLHCWVGLEASDLVPGWQSD
eukprot:TRINITY_DN35905_c2_g1_i1.p1 TRINITY_DN35905_c2_g1~~TRINITY_DN35905_c2_g1_i1.p1  ORF type:complete len:577 (+),score=97.48 TRINITY_DN35905_c2_g1_i1:59-1732(+)